MKVNFFGKQIECRTEFVVIGAAVLILLGCIAGYLISRDGSDIIIETTTAPVASTSDVQNRSTAGTTPTGIDSTALAATDATISAAGQIKVYVVGCVNKPGIVTLEKGQVIDDAVMKAGGLTDEADASSINMVYELNENTMLTIKSKKELEQKGAGEATASAAKSGSAKNSAVNGGTVKSGAVTAGNDSEDTLGEGAEIGKGAGSGVEITASGNDNGDGSSGNGGGIENAGLININTADVAELDKLPGVGEATAQEIITYRERNGPFRKIEDIMKVPRIKQARFDSIKDLISVE